MNPAEFANIARTEQHLWWYQGMLKILIGILDPIAAARQFVRVAEAGCGTGYLAKLLQQRYEWSITPIDLAWEGLSYARAHGASGLVQADISSLPFRPATFDLLLSMDVLIHFPPGKEQAAFGELARLLATDGLFILRVSALDILRSRHSQYVRERQRFTRARLMRAVTAAGLEVIRCTYANTLLLPVSFAKARLWEPLLCRAPASGVASIPGVLNNLLYFPLHLESKWIAAGHNLPIGQSLILIGRKPR